MTQKTGNKNLWKSSNFPTSTKGFPSGFHHQPSKRNKARSIAVLPCPPPHLANGLLFQPYDSNNIVTGFDPSLVGGIPTPLKSII